MTALRPSILLFALLTALPVRADYFDHFVVREDVGIHKSPYLGEAQLLLIPVEVAGHPPLDKEKLKRFFADDQPGGFVHYYRVASVGRFSPHVTIAPVVQFDRCPLPAAQFPHCEIRRGDVTAFSAGIDMLRETVRQLKDTGYDFSRFDVNGRRGTPDGYMDGVMLLTNSPFGGIAFPFAYFNSGSNLNGGTGGPLVVGGLKISVIGIAGYGNLNVMVHEFGHLLGLTDLYDESRGYEGLHFSFMGAWFYDEGIPLPDAESRLRLRWANLHQLETGGRAIIDPVETSGQVYRYGFGDEYFLIENRGPGAFDKGFTSRGLAVYHVDRRGLKGDEGQFVQRLLWCVNCDPWRPYIRIIQADHKFELQLGGKPTYEDDLFRDGDALAPDQTGVPVSATHPIQSTNWYSGEPSGLFIRDVKVLADDRIEVTFDAPHTPGACDEALCADGPGCKPVTCAPNGGGCAAGGQGVGGLALSLVLAALVGPRRRVSPS